MPKRAIGVHTREGSNVYQWRIKVPDDLRHLYPGKEWAHRCTLGTPNLRVANLTATRLRTEWLERFEMQRAGVNAGSTELEPFGPEWTDYLTARHVHDVLASDEETRSREGVAALRAVATERGLVVNVGPLDGLPEFVAGAFAEVNEDNLARLRDQLRRRDLRPTLEWLNSHGLAASETDPGLAPFLDAYLKAAVRAAEFKVRRDKGELIETPPEPPIPTKSKVWHLRDVFDKWKAAKGSSRTADTVKARERALALFEESTGNPALQNITRAMGYDFSAWLQKQGGTSKTAADRLTYVKSLLIFAARELELIPKNPWEAISIDYTTEDTRKPWAPEQIEAFFALPLFTEYALPERAKRAGADAAYWVPLLGLFTGARVGELCQLLVSDVVHEHGVPCIDINEVDAGKKLKTKGSRRKVPIHSELIRLGFLDYAQTMKEAGNVSLWPALHLHEEKPSLGFSRWFNEGPRRAVEGVAIPDFHSLRHTVRSAMSAAEVPEPDQDQITGHTVKGSTGTQVYRHVSIRKLQSAVERIEYPTLRLARAYPVRPLGESWPSETPTRPIG